MLAPRRQDIAEVIYNCLNLGLRHSAWKACDSFLCLIKEDFLYPIDRNDDYTVLRLTDARSYGRYKKTFNRMLQRTRIQIMGLNLTTLKLRLKNNRAHCWGFRGMTGDEARDLDYDIYV